METIDSLLTASANVLGYKQNGNIRFVRRFGWIVGIWVKGFPGNVSRKEFLEMFCVLEKKRRAQRKIQSGSYSINKLGRGAGFEVRFD